MPSLFTTWLRRQIKRVQPVLQGFDLQSARNAQDGLGSFSARVMSGRVEYSPIEGWDEARAIWAAPREYLPDGHVLYLHGGGYVTGSLEYSKLFGGVLAASCHKKVLCLGYSLAPEHPFPAALNDALAAYEFMLSSGIAPERLAVAGESAGGGLLFCLMHLLKEKGLPMPACLISISPWADLTLSSVSFEEKKDADIALSQEQLKNFVDCYRPDDVKNPLVSPIFGSFDKFPPAIVFVGSDEILFDDAVAVKKSYAAAKGAGECRLIVEEGLWHAYPLYRTSESEAAVREMNHFMGLYFR